MIATVTPQHQITTGIKSNEEITEVEVGMVLPICTHSWERVYNHRQGACTSISSNTVSMKKM